MTFDNTNFTAYEFTALIATESGQVPVKFPVLIPDSSSLKPEAEQMLNPDISVMPPTVNNLPPAASLDENISLSGFSLEVDKGQSGDASGVLNLPPIPGVVMIPGNIGFLHQYFSALVVVTNGAPGASNLIVKNLTAEIILPPGGDGALDTNDDPLSMAKVNDVPLPKIMPVLHPGPDGKFGTGDDISLLHPAESGQADFTIEGIKEGTHKLDFKITAVLEGLPIGPVNLIGHATGAVLVRNPDFSITLGHPATVRSGEEYDLFVTITNTSKSIANNVSVYLSRLALSGADFVPGEGQEKTIPTILPGSSGTIKYRLVSQKTGKVTATAFQSEDMFGRFTLRMGVGELGIPLSPDSLIIPYTGSLAPDLVEAAVGLLGQAWSVATAPSGALPADVLPIAKQTITSRANDLSEAGLRSLMGDQRIKAVQDLAFDFIGSDNANPAFDELRRRSTQGLNLNNALATQLQAEVASSGVFNFQANYAAQASYRPGHISVIASQAPLRVMVTDAAGSRIGGSAAGEAYREIRYSDQFILSATEGTEITERSTLSLITKIESLSYRVDFAADGPGVFDLGIVVSDSSGTLRQVRFLGVPVLTGSTGSVTLLPGTSATYVLTFDDNGDGNPDRTVNPVSSLVIPDVEPEVVAVTQLSPGFGPGGDKHGRNVAVLFSERVTKETAQNLANYAVEENAVRMAYVQPSGRMAILLLRDGIGPFFGEQDADGKFYGRKITVSGLTDGAGEHHGCAGYKAELDHCRRTGSRGLGKHTHRKGRACLRRNGQAVSARLVRRRIRIDDEVRPLFRKARESRRNVPVRVRVPERRSLRAFHDRGGQYRNERSGEHTDLRASSRTAARHGSLHEGARNRDWRGKERERRGSPECRRDDHDPCGQSRICRHYRRRGELLVHERARGGLQPQGGPPGVRVPGYDHGHPSRRRRLGYSGRDRLQACGHAEGKHFRRRARSGRRNAENGATVIVSAPYYQSWTTTDSEGKYLFTGVYAGNTGQPALVSVSSRDTVTGEESRATGYLADGQTLVLNLIMKGTGTVTGEVRREDNGTISGLIVMANGSRVAYTDASGAFGFEGLPVGEREHNRPEPPDIRHSRLRLSDHPFAGRRAEYSSLHTRERRPAGVHTGHGMQKRRNAVSLGRYLPG